MRRHIIFNNCSVTHTATWVFSIEIARASILFWHFFWFLLYQNFLSENFNSLYMEKNLSRVWEKKREKKHWRRQTTFVHVRIVSPWLCEPFTETDWIFDPVGRTEMSPSIWQNYFPRTADLYILLTSTITNLAVALVWSVQPECTILLSTWIFRNFKQEFLLNGKRGKCLGRKVGPARRLTLQLLQKSDSARWVTPLAESTVCYFNGSPCMFCKEMCQTLLLPARVGWWPFCSRQGVFI